MSTIHMTDADLVIVALRPRPGRVRELKQLLRRHVPYLRELNLATDHPVTILEAGDGTLVEIFEWVPGGAERAHIHPEVHALWSEFWAVCEPVPLNTLAEAGMMFASFRKMEHGISLV